jgi:hypothetical protein
MRGQVFTWWKVSWLRRVAVKVMGIEGWVGWGRKIFLWRWLVFRIFGVVMRVISRFRWRGKVFRSWWQIFLWKTMVIVTRKFWRKIIFVGGLIGWFRGWVMRFRG